MNHYVYETTNLINGKKYIGKRSCECEIKDDKYIGSGVALKCAVKKYGVVNFSKRIIKKFKDSESALEYERRIINDVGACFSKEYYNIAEGGIGGNCFKGKTEEEMKAIYIGRSINVSGEKHWNYGKKMGEEMKARISEKLKGKMEGANNGWSVKVVCLNTREIFDCVAEASRKYGVNASNISMCLNGSRKCAGILDGSKLVWEYLDIFKEMGEDEINSKIENSTKRNDYRKVVLINDMKVFESVTKAKKYAGLKSTSCIIECCQGKRKSAGKINGYKLKWMYYDECMND